MTEIFKIIDKVQDARLLALNKAYCMADDLENNYFDKWEIKTQEERCILALDYLHFQTKTGILLDYLHEAEKLLEAVETDLERIASTLMTAQPTVAAPALLSLLDGLLPEDMELLYKLASGLQGHRKGAPA